MLDPTSCMATGQGKSMGVTGKSNDFTVILKDRYGNDVDVGNDDRLFPVAVLSGPEDRVMDSFDNGRLKSANNLFDFEFAVETQGTYQLTVTVKPSIGTADSPVLAQNIAGSPFTLTIVADVASAESSYASGLGFVRAEPGIEANFQITSLDKFGNTITTRAAGLQRDFVGETEFLWVPVGPDYRI